MRIHILGGGPAGLTLALSLSTAGHDVVVYERSTAPTQAWRASTFHAAVLDLLADLSRPLIAAMHARGLVATDHRIHDRRAGLIASFDFSELHDETQHPYRLQLEQYKYSELLMDLLADQANVSVRYGHEFVPDGAGWGYVRDAASGDTYDLDGFVVGADGAQSSLRKAVGVNFPGLTYPQRFLIVSVQGAVERLQPDLGLVNYIWDPTDPAMVLRIPDLWRIMFHVDADADAAEWSSLAQHRLQALSPHNASLVELVSGKVYSVHQRVADSFVGSSWALIGDAAHVNSPLGGLGLNGGILDALHLGHVLNSSHQEPEEVDLRAYSKLRHECATDFVRRVTDHNTDAMFETDEVRRQRNIDDVRAVVQDDDSRRTWLREASMLNARESYFDKAVT